MGSYGTFGMAAAGAIGKSIGATEASAKPETNTCQKLLYT